MSILELTASAKASRALRMLQAAQPLAQTEVPFPPFYDHQDFFLPTDFSVVLSDQGPDQKSYAYANYTAEEIFDLYSTARINPDLTYYIDPVNGNDTTGDGLTESTAWRSPTKATTTAMAGNKTLKIFYRASASSDLGDGTKAYTMTAGSLSALNNLSVDCCVIFYNGPGVMSTHNQYAAPSLFTGATNTYAVPISVATDNVLDLTDVNEYGIAKPMRFVPWVASGDIPAQTWSTDGTNTIIRRKDNLPVTNVLNRIIDVSPNIRSTNHVSFGLFPATPSDTLRVYGGGNVNGAVDITVPNTYVGQTTRTICAKNVTTVSYAFNSTGAGRGWSIDGIHGIVFLENCAAIGAKTDGFNFHITRYTNDPLARMRVVTLNCVGIDCGTDVRALGRSNEISCNPNTFHENVWGMDFAGYYFNASGGCVRNIGGTKTFYAGTMVHDRGDRWLGSTTHSTGFRAQDTAEIYCFRTKIAYSGLGASIGYHNAGGGIYLNDCWYHRGHNIGTISTWG